MREFIKRFNPFDKGLDPIKGRNPDFLINGYNTRITSNGPEAINFDMLTYITSAALYDLNIDVNEVFPQVFSVFDKYYLLTETKLYEVEDSSITQIYMYDAYMSDKHFLSPSPSNSITAIANGKWSVAYIGDTIMFVNGKSTIFKRSTDVYWHIENTISIKSCEEYKGHIITAGFDDTYYNQSWKDYFSQAYANITYVNPTMDKNTIVWSVVNAGDLFWLFYPDEAFEGPLGFDADYDFYKSWIFRGDAGFINLPELNGVLQVKKSGDLLFAYGAKRSAVLSFVTDPVPTLTVVAYLDYGLQNKNAIAGNNTNHFIIDNKNNLRKIESGKVNKIGFSKYLSTEDYSLAYHEKYDEVYINGVSKKYTFNSGLMELLYVIPSAFSYEGVEYLIYK